MTSPTAGPRRGGWYYGWNIVAVCVLAGIAANGLPISCLSLFLGNWAHDLHTPISSLLIALLPLAFVTALASPVIGALADRYPARWLFGAGLVGVTVFCLGISLATTTWHIWVLYGFYPVALGLCAAVPANAVVSRWFVRRLGLALGATAFGMGVAGVVLPPLVAAVIPSLGWRAIWQITAAFLAFVALPLVLLVLRDRPTERDGLHYLVSDGSAPAHHGHGGTAAGGGLRSIDILKRRNFWLLVCCLVPVIGAYGGCQQLLAPVAASRGFGQGVAGMLLSVFSVSYVTSTLLMGVASDRFGNRLPLAGVAVVVAVGTALLGSATSLPVIVVAAALVGFGGGLWTLLPAAVALEFGAANVGRTFGMLLLFLPINASIPSIISRVQESTGSYAPSLLALGAFCLLGGCLVLLIRERRGGHATEEERAAAAREPVTPIP